MNRRNFLKKSAIVTPIILTASGGILQSCDEEEININYNGKIGIIGAGASGLYSAFLLNKKGAKNIQIFEANNTYGGRIKPLNSFADFTIELGAEIIHGNKSIFYKLAKETNCQFTTTETEDLYYFKNGLKTETQAVNDTDFNSVVNIQDNIANYNGADITVQQYATNQNINTELQPYLNTILGNENGTDIANISIKGIADADNLWSAGEENYDIKNKSILSIFEEKFAPIFGKILLNNQIIKIEYSDSKVIITNQNNTTFELDKLIITVPISILKNNEINFIPALPINKINAFTKIGMDTGMKIILKFSTPFWQNNLGSLYGNNYIPEFWQTSIDRSQTYHILTAFVMGNKAQYLSNLASDNLRIQTALSELTTIFGNNLPTTNFVSGVVMDWSKMPFIKGAYSYPKVGFGGAREAIAEKVGNTMFFAGEATHTGGHFATVHGALESAERVVAELITTL